MVKAISNMGDYTTNLITNEENISKSANVNQNLDYATMNNGVIFEKEKK